MEGDATVAEARRKAIETVDDRAPITEPRAKSRSGVKIETPEVSSATSLQRPKSKKRKFGVGRAALLGVVVVALLAAALFAFQRYAWLRQTPLKMVFPPVADRDLIAADVAPFQKYLEDVLHRPVEISVATSYEDLLETVVAGRADVGVLPPNTYVHAKLKDPRIEILASKLIDGSSGSDGEIFVPQTSTAHALVDLKGKRVCFSDPLSTTGYLLPRKAFRDAGLDPDKDIISHISGTHTQVLRDLVNDVCDAGATYSGGYLAADRAGIPVAQVRHFLFTGRTPQDAICGTSTLSASDRKKVQNALFAFDAKKAGTMGGHVERITGFSRSTDHDYDSVREVQP
jgi:phosphonate transport system substrate-binding protein